MRFTNRIILRLLAIFVIAISFSQASLYAQATGDPREDFLYGEYYLSQKKYEKALPFYLAPLVITKGDDGIHRYTYGEYPSIPKALEELGAIRDMGFWDAFIRNVNMIQNYQGY